MNSAQRASILRQIRQIRADLNRIDTTVTRFERELNPGNILDRQKTTAKTAKKTSSAVVKAPKKDIKISGTVKRDPMYDLELEFSDEGDGYSNPLVNPTAGEDYYIRCRIRQHQAEPLLQGFETEWRKPAGWTWVDGLSTRLFDEAISNPAVITRVARAPATQRGGKFKVVVVERYLG